MFLILSRWLGIVIFLLEPVGEIHETHWKVSPKSVIEITGSTNVSRFRCQSSQHSNRDLLKEIYFPHTGKVEWSGIIRIQSTQFECFNKVMTKDFHETVKADEHPEIVVKFISLTRNVDKSALTLDGEAEISLAGVTRKFPISCRTKFLEDGKTMFSGQQDLTFADFNIDPPVKFLGTVKVQNSITVNFDLILEKI